MLWKKWETCFDLCQGHQWTQIPSHTDLLPDFHSLWWPTWNFINTAQLGYLISENQLQQPLFSSLTEFMGSLKNGKGKGAHMPCLRHTNAPCSIRWRYLVFLRRILKMWFTLFVITEYMQIHFDLLCLGDSWGFHKKRKARLLWKTSWKN